MTALQLIGYWRGENDTNAKYPHPSDWVDWRWDDDERALTGSYFAAGTLFRACMGLSPCRICARPNGAAEYTDGTFVWPEGLAHYIDDHAVRLPAKVVEHAVSRMETFEGSPVSEDLWLAEPPVREGTASSATNDDPGLDTRANSIQSRSEITQYLDNDSPDERYLDPTGVWIRMAKNLVAADGPKILKSSMRGSIVNGRAEVTWSESHELTEADYKILVAKAREQAILES